jgi:hypothetical protein
MHPDNADAAGHDGRPVMERFGRDARLDVRMLKDGQAITDGQRKALVKELQAYRDAHLVEGKPISLAKIVDRGVGISLSVLSEWVCRC